MNCRKNVMLAMFAALSVVLGYIKFFKMPYGGSISLTALPMILASIMLGPKFSLCLVIFVVFLKIIFATIYHPLSILFDYIFAYLPFGFVGIFSKTKIEIVISIFFAFLIKYFSHFLSGIIVFKNFIPDSKNIFVYSAVTNLIPNFASFLLNAAVTLIILRLPDFKK